MMMYTILQSTGHFCSCTVVANFQNANYNAAGSVSTKM